MTFTDYFGFKQNPFGLAQNDAFLSLDANVDLCQKILRDIADGYSPILLTGEPGSGKTQLLQRVSTLLPPEIFNLRPFNSCMGIAERVEMTLASQAIEFNRSKRVLLVVDNAEEIPEADLQSLLSFHLRDEFVGKSFQMIWCGSTQTLDIKLNNIDAVKFNSLYPNYYRIVPLTEAQVKSYVEECLKRAGYPLEKQGDVFSSAAAQEIARLSKGLLSAVNQLCSVSLTLAMLDHRKQVDGQLAQEAFILSLMSPDKAENAAAHNNGIAPEDILKNSQHKLTAKYIKRFLGYYWLKACSFEKNQFLDKGVFAHKNTNILVGGIVVASLCLLLVSSLKNGKQDVPQEAARNAELMVVAESKSPEAIESPVAPEPQQPPVAAEPSAVNNPNVEPPKKPTADTQIATIVTPVLETPDKTKAVPTPATLSAAITKQTEIKVENAPVLTKNTPSPKVEPHAGTGFKSARNRADHLIVSVQRPIHRIIPSEKHPKPLINKHSLVRIDNVKPPQRKPVTETKPEFVLKPLDAPGSWDEIVILDDPKKPQNGKQPTVLETPPVLQEETKSEGLRANNHKRTSKAKFVLKPLDAPGKYDEIVIVDDPKSTNKNGSSSAASAGQPVAPPNKPDSLLHLDKSNYQYLDQIIIVDEPQPPRKVQKKQ